MHALDKKQRGKPQKAQKAQKIMCFLCLLWLISLVTFESGCRSSAPPPVPEPGVSLALATKRARSIESLSYELSFTLPAAATESITGHEIIKFSTKDITEPLVIDFSPGADHLKS